MQVQKYLFQSPYSSPVQFGRPDPTTKEDGAQQQLLKSTNETAFKAQVFESSQKKEVTPTVSSNNLLDLYA